MYHILFGFDDEDTVKAIIRIVKKQSGLKEIGYSIQTTKDAIQEYVKYNKDCTTIILREIMDGESWSAEELAELNDWKTFNIIVVVDSEHKGTEYIQTLYTAGITNAFLVEKGGFVTPGEIAHFVINPRNRASARKVYGMNSVKVPVNVLTSDVYLKKYAYLMDDTQGVNFIDRYLIIVKDFSVKIAVEFTKKLPSNVIKKLVEYEEFWKVCEHYVNCGFKINLKKPKTLRKGMTDEAFRNLMKRSKGQIEIPSEYKKKVFKEEPDALEEVAGQGNYFDEMVSLFNEISPQNIPKTQKEVISVRNVAPKVKNVQQENKTSIKIQQAVPKAKAPQKSKVVPKAVASSKQAKNSVSSVPTPKNKEPKVRSKINWKLVVGIFAIALLLLIIFYFVIQLGIL